MTKRVFNFNVGPAVLPLEVLEQAQAEVVGFQRYGHVCDGDQSPIEGV